VHWRALYIRNLRIPPRVSEEEDTDESRPADLGPAKGEIGRGSGTVASIKRTTEAGLSPSWVKMLILSWAVFPVDDGADCDIFPPDAIVSIKCKVGVGVYPPHGSQ